MIATLEPSTACGVVGAHSTRGTRSVAPTPAIRAATVDEASRLHELIADHRVEGRLLSRSLAELQAHATRFFVAHDGPAIVGCGELAPLGTWTAEVRSLVVEAAFRGAGTGTGLVRAIIDRACARQFARLVAFTHDPGPFVRMGFSILPRLWVPEKIAADCVACERLRDCAQYALRFDLGPAATGATGA